MSDRKRRPGILTLLERHEAHLERFIKVGDAYQRGRNMATDIARLLGAGAALSIPVLQAVSARFDVPGLPVFGLSPGPGLKLILIVLFIGLIGFVFPTLVSLVERWFAGEWARVLAAFVGLVTGYAVASLGDWMTPTNGSATAKAWFLALVAVALVGFTFIARLRLQSSPCRDRAEITCRAIALLFVPMSAALFATMFMLVER